MAESGEGRSRIRLAADIGGTFTDVAAFDEEAGTLLLGKTLSTPERLVDGIESAVARAGTEFTDAALFLHGSTIAVNTILERTGARTALITTEGFRDVYEIGRINRPDSYNLFFQKHEPLVERALRFEASERVLASGEIERPLDDAEIAALGRRIDALGMEAVAILFFALLPQPRARAPGEGDPGRRPPASLRVGLPRAVPGVSGVRTHLDRCRQRLYRPEGGRLYRRNRRPFEAGGLRRIVSGRAIHRRALRGRRGAALLRADAGIGSGRRGDRHPGVVRGARAGQRDRLRHGRDDRESRGDLQGRGADHRGRASRRLREGAAGADRDDGHLRGLRRRGLDRPDRRGRRAPCRPL